MRLAAAIVSLIMAVPTGVAEGRTTRKDTRGRPPAEVYREAQDYLRSQGMVLEGPRAPEAAGATSEALVRELVRQLREKNMRGMLSLLWNGEGVTCSKVEDEARRRIAEECAASLGRLTVFEVPPDARLNRLEAMKVKPGARVEGCTAKEATAVERWAIASTKARHTVTVVRTGTSGWKLIRVEVGEEK